MVGSGARRLAVVVLLGLLAFAADVPARYGGAQEVATPAAEADPARTDDALRARIAQLEAQIVAMGGTPVPGPPGAEFFPATPDPGIAERDYLERVYRQTVVLGESYAILTDLLTIRASTSDDQAFRDQANTRAADVELVGAQAAAMTVPARYGDFHADYRDALAAIRTYTAAANACFQSGGDADCAAASAQAEALRRLRQVAADLDALRTANR